MAAATELRTPEVVELRQVRSGDLREMLRRETEEWRAELDWDFYPSAELVERFVAMRALGGFALIDGGRVAGYAYTVCEERKGLIGDLYVLPGHRTVGNENLLLEAVLDGMMRTPYICRVESQLMMLEGYFERPFPREAYLSRHGRQFMTIDAGVAAGLAPGVVAERVRIEGCQDWQQDAAARVIAAAYEGHVDSRINDQYRSVAGARRFLTNIVQYPGCGSFYQPGSFLAMDLSGGRMVGLSLASLIAADVGHITQICVLPGVRGTGLGYELLRRSLAALGGAGCRKASLTVTSGNREAVRLYERMGFRTVKTFAATVWEW